MEDLNLLKLDLVVINKNITTKNKNIGSLTSGSLNVDKVTFEFVGDIWNDVVKTAIFVVKDKAYKRVLDENNSCEVPREVYLKNSNVYVGVFGTKGTEDTLEQVVSSSLSLMGVVEAGAYTKATEAEDLPTPSQWDAYLHTIQQMIDASVKDTLGGAY